MFNSEVKVLRRDPLAQWKRMIENNIECMQGSRGNGYRSGHFRSAEQGGNGNCLQLPLYNVQYQEINREETICSNISREIVICEPAEQGITGQDILNHQYDNQNTDDDVKKLAMVNQKGRKLENSETTDLCVQSFNLDNSKRACNEVIESHSCQKINYVSHKGETDSEEMSMNFLNNNEAVYSTDIKDDYRQLFTDDFVSDTYFYFNHVGNIESDDTNTYTQNTDIHNAGISSHECTAVSNVASTSTVDEHKWTDEIHKHVDHVTGEPDNAGSTGTVCKIHNCCHISDLVDNGQSTLNTDTDCNIHNYFQSVGNGLSTHSTGIDCNYFQGVDNGQSTHSTGTDCKTNNDCFHFAGGVDNNQSTFNTDKDGKTHNKCFQSLQSALNTGKDYKRHNQSIRDVDNHQSTLKTDKDCKTHSYFQNVDIGQSRLNRSEVGTQDLSSCERQDVRMWLKTVDQERLGVNMDSAVSFVNAYNNEYMKTKLEHTFPSSKRIQANEGNIIRISHSRASDDEFDACNKDIDESFANNTSDTNRTKDPVRISSKKIIKNLSENNCLQDSVRHTPDCILPACDITTSTIFGEKKNPVKDGCRTLTPYILTAEEPVTSIVNKAQKKRCIPKSGSVTPVYANATLTKPTHKTEAYNSVIDCCSHTKMSDTEKEYYSVISFECAVSLSITNSVKTSRNVYALLLPPLAHFLSRQLPLSMSRQTELYKSASADNLAIENVYKSWTNCTNSVKQDTTCKVLYADSKCSHNTRSMTSRKDFSISDCRQRCCGCDDQNISNCFEHYTVKLSKSYPSKRKESKATYCSGQEKGSKHLTRHPMTQWTRLINANIEAMLKNKRVEVDHSKFGGGERQACVFGTSGLLYTRSLDTENIISGSYDSSNLLWQDYSNLSNDNCNLQEDYCNLQKVHSEKNHEVNKYQKTSNNSNVIISLNSSEQKHNCCNKTDVSILKKDDDGEIDPGSNNLSMNIVEENKLQSYETVETDDWHWYSAKSGSIGCSFSQDHIGSYCHERTMNAIYDQKESEMLSEKCMNVCENHETTAVQDINAGISHMSSTPQINNNEPAVVCTLNSVVHIGESVEVYKHDIDGQNDPVFVRNHTAYTENEISDSTYKYANGNDNIKECNVGGFRHSDMPWRQCTKKDVCSLVINDCGSHDRKEVSTDEVRAQDMTTSEIVNDSECLNTTLSDLDDSMKGGDSCTNTSYDKHKAMYTFDSSETTQTSKCETNVLQGVTVSEFNSCDGDIDGDIAYVLDTDGAREHLHFPRSNQFMRQCANGHQQDTTTNTSYKIDSKICYCEITTSDTLDRKLDKLATNSSISVASGIIETSTNITSVEQNDVSCIQHSDNVASLHDDATLDGREDEAEENQSDIDVRCGISVFKKSVSISKSACNLNVPAFQHTMSRKNELCQGTSVENLATKDACRSYAFCLKSMKPNTVDGKSYTETRGENNGKSGVKITGFNSGKPDTEIKDANSEKFDTEIRSANNDTEIRGANNDTEIRGANNDTEIRGANNDTEIGSANNYTEIRSANNDTEIRSANNDTEIRGANNDTEIGSANNDTEIGSANNYTEVRGANNDTEIGSANNDTEIRSANNDTEIRSANNDTEIRGANNDTEIGSANNDTEIGSANNYTEVRGAYNDIEIRSANNDTGIRGANNDAKIKCANNDTEIRGTNNGKYHTEIRSANNGIYVMPLADCSGYVWKKGYNVKDNNDFFQCIAASKITKSHNSVRKEHKTVNAEDSNKTVKHLTRNPVTQWTRLVNANIEAVLRKKTETIDQQKYVGTGFEPCVFVKSGFMQTTHHVNIKKIQSRNSADIRRDNNDTEIRSVNKDTEIRSVNKDTEIRNANKDTEIRSVNNDAEIRNVNKDTEIRSVNKDTEIRNANKDTEIRSVNNDAEIRNANNDAKIRDANNDAEIRSANNDAEIRRANNDVEIRSANNDTEIRRANNDVEIRSANNDTEIRSANIDTEIRSVNNDAEIRNANNDAKIRDANNDAEIRSANNDAEIRRANNDAEIRRANNDVEIRSANNDTEIRSANNNAEMRSTNNDTEIRGANNGESDTEIISADNDIEVNSDTEIRGTNKDTEIRGTNNGESNTEIISADNDNDIRSTNKDTEIRSTNNDAEIISADNDNDIRSTNKVTEIRSANKDTEIRSANKVIEIRCANSDTESRSANSDTEIRCTNNDTEIRGANNEESGTDHRCANNNTEVNNDSEIRGTINGKSDTEIRSTNTGKCDTEIRGANIGICVMPFTDCSGYVWKKGYNVKDNNDLLQCIAAAKITESHNSVRKEHKSVDTANSNKKVKHLTRNPVTNWTRLVNSNIEAVLRKKTHTTDQHKYGDRDFEPRKFVTSGCLQTAQRVNIKKIQSESSNVNILQISHNNYHLDTVLKKEYNKLRNNKNMYSIPETIVNLNFQECNTGCHKTVSNIVNKTCGDDNIDVTSKNVPMKVLEKIKPEKVEFAEKDEWHWYSINLGSIGCVCNQDGLETYHHDTEMNAYGQKEVKVFVDENCDHVVNEVMVVNRPPILPALQFQNISNDTNFTMPVCETECIETNTAAGKEENNVIFMKECKEYTQVSRMYNEQENKRDYFNNDNSKNEQNTEEVYGQNLTNTRIPDIGESLKKNEQVILCGHRTHTDSVEHVCNDKYIKKQLKYTSTSNERIHAKTLDTFQSLQVDVSSSELDSCSNDFDSNNVSDINETMKRLHIHSEKEFRIQCDRNRHEDAVRRATLKPETQVFSKDNNTSEVSDEENKAVKVRSKSVVPLTIDTVLRSISEFDEKHKMNYCQQSGSFVSLLDDMSTINTCTDKNKYCGGALSKRNSVRISKSAHALIISTLPHSVFKQNRLYQSTSAENIVSKDRHKTRTCQRKIRKPNRLSRISNSAIRGAITGKSIDKSRAELSGDGCRRGCIEEDKTTSLQCLQQATVNISQLHPSHNVDSKGKYCMVHTQESSGTVKHLTRNPVTQWTRLVNDNIEAIFKTTVGEIDHAKYGGGDFEACTSGKSKSYVFPDRSLVTTSGESETAKTDTEQLCLCSNDILSVKKVNVMPGISSICTEFMEASLGEQVKCLTSDLCQSGENKAADYVCSVTDAAFKDSLLDYYKFDDDGNTVVGLQCQEKENLHVCNSRTDVSTVVECSLDETVCQNTSEENGSSLYHLCDCGAAGCVMGHHDDAVLCVPSGGCHELKANTLNGLSVDELDNEPSSDMCCTENGECKLQNMEQLNDEHSIVSKTVSLHNRITGGNLSESEIRVTALNNRQGMFNSGPASDAKEAISSSTDCLQCLKSENDHQETHTFQYPITLERADAKLQCKSISQQQIQQKVLLNQWNNISLTSPFWHSKRPLKSLDVTIYVHKSKGRDNIFSKNKSMDCDDKVGITGENMDKNIISKTNKRKYQENTSRTDKSKDMDMIFCTDEKRYQETISSTDNGKDQDKIFSKRKIKNKKDEISSSSNSKDKNIIPSKGKSDEHSNISQIGVAIQISEDIDRVSSNSFTEVELGNVAKQDRAVEMLDQPSCEDRSYNTGWSRFWHFMTHIFTDISTPQPHDNDVANQELTIQNKQSSQDATTLDLKHNVHCSKDVQGQECNELGSIFICDMDSLHNNDNNEQQTLNSVCNKIYSDRKQHRKQKNITGNKLISCEANSAATEYGETVKSTIKSSNQTKSIIDTDWREPKENILFRDQVVNTCVGTGYLSIDKNIELCSYFLVPQDYSNINDAKIKQNLDKSDSETVSSRKQETLTDNTEFSGLCEYKKMHNKTRIPVLISRHSKNMIQDVSNIKTTGRCHENEGNSLKSRREHKHENESKVKNHNMLETGGFVTITGNNVSEHERVCDLHIIQGKTSKMFLVENADTTTTIYEDISQCEVESKNDGPLHKIGAAETHSRKYSTTSTSIKDDKDNTVHLLDIPARIREKVTVNTKSTSNDANLRDYFQDLVALNHRAPAISQHAQGSCKNEYCDCDQTGSELLQSSLECLLEMLLQRGKVTHAFIANTEGEIMAKTAKCGVATIGIKNILFSLSSSYRGMVKIVVANDVYTCFKHDQDSLIGRATTNIFVARRGRQSIVVGFSDEATPGSCIKEVQEISELLSHRGL